MTQPFTDHLLETLLDIVSQPVGRLSGLTVTVMTSGLVVSGIAISEEAYFERLGAQFGSGIADASPDVQAEFQTLFTSMSEVAQSAAHDREARKSELSVRLLAGGDPPSDAELRSLERAYIYMKDVFIYGDGGAPIELPLWRGRLMDVTGWSLGHLRPSADLDAKELARRHDVGVGGGAASAGQPHAVSVGRAHAGQSRR